MRKLGAFVYKIKSCCKESNDIKIEWLQWWGIDIGKLSGCPFLMSRYHLFIYFLDKDSIEGNVISILFLKVK